MCLILVECHKPCFKVQVILLGGSFGYGYLLNFNCRNLKFQNREDHVNIHSTSTSKSGPWAKSLDYIDFNGCNLRCYKLENYDQINSFKIEACNWQWNAKNLKE